MYEQAQQPTFDIDYVIKYTPNPDANTIINQILTGIDIILVDPQLYPHLLPPLQVFRDNFQETGQKELVKKCEFLQEYMSDYPHRQQISRMLMNRPPSPPPKPPVLSQDEVNQIVDNLLETDEIHFFPREELELILAELRKRRAQFQQNGEYLKAQRADQYTKSILNYGQLGAVEQLQNKKVDDIRTKLKDAETQLVADKKKWENLYTNLKNEAKKDLISINNNFEQQISELLDKLKKDENGNISIPANFRKASGNLLQLRARQKAMVEAKKYEEAAQIKEKADETEKNEKTEQENRYKEYINGKVNLKRNDQRKALNVRKKYWKQQEEALVKQANSEVEKAEMSIEHIKKNLREAENAQNIATVLKETTKNQSKKVSNANGLPPLKSRAAAAAEYRQRAILNSKIYTRPVAAQQTSSPITVRNK